MTDAKARLLGRLLSTFGRLDSGLLRTLCWQGGVACLNKCAHRH